MGVEELLDSYYANVLEPPAAGADGPNAANGTGSNRRREAQQAAKSSAAAVARVRKEAARRLDPKPRYAVVVKE